MKYTTVSQLYASPDAYFDKQITVCGWVRTIRDSKNFAFVELNDGSHFKSLQIVLESSRLVNYEQIVKQNVGAALVVKGVLCATPQAKAARLRLRRTRFVLRERALPITRYRKNAIRLIT